MARYRVNTGYYLYLPHGRVAEPGEEVELAGDLEQEVLAKQGWKVSLAEPVHLPGGSSGPAEEKAMEEPPQDRAVRRARVK